MPYKRGKKWVGKIEADGKSVYCGTNHPTKTAAKDAETAERKRRTGRTLGGQEPCASFAERWLRDYPYGRNKRVRHKNTVANYTYLLQEFEEHPDFKDVPIEEVARPIIMDFARAYPRVAKVVATMFEDAYNDGLITQNHWRRIGLPEKRDQADILTLEEFEHACEVCELVHGPEYGPRFRALFEFAAETGIRPGELFALRRENLRIAVNEVDVKLQTYRDGTQDTPKNYLERTVALNEYAIAAVRRLPARMDGLLFSSITGKSMTEGILSKDWQRVRDGIGRPDLRFYDATRHFCGSQLALQGVPMEDIAWQLGHTDNGDTARKHYVHLYPKETKAKVLAASRARQGRNVAPLRRVEDGASGA